MPFANNEDADQPAHPRSLISAFVVRCPDNINTSSCSIQNFKTLASLCFLVTWLTHLTYRFFRLYTLIRNAYDLDPLSLAVALAGATPPCTELFFMSIIITHGIF